MSLAAPGPPGPRGVGQERLIVGVDAVRTAIKAGKCYCVVVASDASPRAEEKVTRLARAKGLAVIVGPGADEIGRALGRPPVHGGRCK